MYTYTIIYYSYLILYFFFFTFFFNDTATTEIYTLSLHDALPILSDTLSSVSVIIGAILIRFFDIYWIDPVITLIISIYILRSEEHTSELQSLARISYAVFCLKKKKKINKKRKT